MLISEIITECRSAVNDTTSANYKFQDADWLTALQSFFNTVAGTNAEVLLDARGRMGTTPTGQVATNDFPWDAIYRFPAVAYLCWKYFTSDSAGTRNDAMAKHYYDIYQGWFTPARAGQ